ncbi:MAG: DUF1501 domain-containing protein [Candidatus Koribacter versatilis]|uniref:DUF1501 domain-containing protein n=1 Tax=Candidatus Korobacter versatilis TaxID=658062 RepID=A0A932A8G7_9BACT|nr:DUF1501 domain-containing protein [Candidatus Koribacter versatilis]
MSITRRAFMKGGAMAVVGTAAVPSFLTRAALGAETSGGRKRFVVLFQRGAADGLNIVIPHGERDYYAMRPSISIPRGQELDLDGFFGLHPSMAALKPLWEQKHLAIIHAAGSPDTTRSHFDAQDYMESGTPGVKSTEDGWLNRVCQSEKKQDASPFRAVALGGGMPRALSGRYPAIAIDNVNQFGVGGNNPGAQPAANGFEAMYAQSVDSVLHGTGKETFEAVKMLKAADPAQYRPAPGANYPRGRFGDSLRQVSQLLKANLGVEVAFADIGGWDHHVNEGATQGQLANLLREFSQSLAAFWTDLGTLAEETVIVSMTEFGRTARQNGNGGTDHGHAGAMFVMGGPVRGGRVYGKWPGLAPGQLYEGRDLALTTDFRRILGEGVYRHLGNKQLDVVFPGFASSPQGFLGLLG